MNNSTFSTELLRAMRQLVDPQAEDRDNCRRYLSDNRRAAWKTLKSVITSNDVIDRHGAVLAIQSLGLRNRDAIGFLKQTLTDSAPEVRATSCWACETIGKRAVSLRREVTYCLEDKFWYVRQAAIYAVVRLFPDDRSTAQCVFHALNDRESHVRATAAKLSPAVRFVTAQHLVRLKREEKSDDYIVSQYAKNAISKIQRRK